MNGLWLRSQDGKYLMLAQEFEVDRSATGIAYIYANCREVGIYKSEERALEVLREIEDQLRKGSSFDDMYGSRRVGKVNIFIMPKE